MLNKVSIIEFPQLKGKFNELIIKFPTVNAVISNIQEGFVYSDNNNESVFICAKYGWSLLLIADSSKVGELFDFLKANHNIPDYIHILPPNDEIIKYIKDHWPKYKIRTRCQFKHYDVLKNTEYLNQMPYGYSLLKIQDITFSKLNVFKFDLDKRYWKSAEDFKTNALGVCLLNSSNDPIAICYSICIVDNMAEVEIFVLPEYQGKGFGRIVGEAFLFRTKEKGIIAHWDAFATNVPSLELAGKLGFQKIQEYNMISTFLRDW